MSPELAGRAFSPSSTPGVVLPSSTAPTGSGRAVIYTRVCAYPGCGATFTTKRERRKWCSPHGRERDPQASHPFAPEEQAWILGAADAMAVNLNATRRVGEFVESDWFMGCVVRCYLYLGFHPSVLGRLKGSDVRTRIVGGKERTFLYWTRPKNQKRIEFPVSSHLMPWLPDFLDYPKPIHRSRYNQLFDLLAEELKKRGHPMQVNPLRFRHTCAWNLRHEFGLDVAEIQKMMGTTLQVLMTYVESTDEQVATTLEAKGW